MICKVFVSFTILFVILNYVKSDATTGLAGQRRNGQQDDANMRQNNEIQPGRAQNNELDIQTENFDINPRKNKRRNFVVDQSLEPNERRSKKKSKRRRGKKQRRGKKSFKEQDFDIDGLDEEEQKEIIRTTMKYMFGFDHINTETSKIEGSHPKTNHMRPTAGSIRHEVPKPPHFMLEMYRTYTDDKSLMMLHSISQGNTIRSYFPISVDPERSRDKGKPVTIAPVVEDGSTIDTLLETQIPVFFFNLSNIPTTEALVGAEIRLEDVTESLTNEDLLNNQGRSRYDFATEDLHSNSNTKYDGSWYVVAAVYRRDIADCGQDNICHEVFSMVGDAIKLSPSSSDMWSDKNLSKKAEAARQTDKILVVKFQRESFHNETSHHRHTRSTDRQFLPKSFSVIGFERPKRDSEMNSILRSSVPFRSTASSPTHESDEQYLTLNNNSELDISLVPILIVYCNDTRTTIQSKDKSLTPLIWKALNNITSTSNKRKRRSADDLPESQMPSHTELRDSTNAGNWQTDTWTTYKVNKGKVTSSKKINTYPNEHTNEIEDPIENDLTELHDNKKGNRMLMKSLKNKKSLRRGKRRGKGKKNRRKGGRKQRMQKLNRDSNEVSEDCGRRELVVDFAEIGWSDWIISPTAFDAYYCSGICAFPRMSKMNVGASNHALIQGLIRAIGGNKAVPAPCCTPEKMMSLSVLFFDEYDNVVLKVYPDMSVETCACR